MGITAIKKSFNEKFPRSTVKVETSSGHYRPLRDSQNKTIRRIPTYIQLSPVDCTDVKPKKIQAKFQEMIDFLKSQGGILKCKSSNHAIVEFKIKNKEFSVHIFLEKYRATHIYDGAYQNVFFDVNFIKN